MIPQGLPFLRHMEAAERERENSPRESSESAPEGQRPNIPGLYTSRSEIVSETASTTRDNPGPDAPLLQCLGIL